MPNLYENLAFLMVFVISKKNNGKNGLKRTFFTKNRPFLGLKINNGPFTDRSPLKRTELHALQTVLPPESVFLTPFIRIRLIIE